jgi:hypothetical protein
MPAADYIYMIQSSYLPFVKIGRWSGSIKKLHKRYQTYYPCLKCTIFQCQDRILLEKSVLLHLSEYKIEGELFKTDCIPFFLDFINEHSYNYCDKTLKKTLIPKKVPKVISKVIHKDIPKIDIPKDVPKVIPKSIQVRESLFEFLSSYTIYIKDNVITMSDVREKFNQVLGLNVRGLDNGTFTQVNEDYIVEALNFCKHCNKEAISGCCDKYNNKDRTIKKIVRNMGFVKSIINENTTPHASEHD